MKTILYFNLLVKRKKSMNEIIHNPRDQHRPSENQSNWSKNVSRIINVLSNLLISLICELSWKIWCYKKELYHRSGRSVMILRNLYKNKISWICYPYVTTASWNSPTTCE